MCGSAFELPSFRGGGSSPVFLGCVLVRNIPVFWGWCMDINLANPPQKSNIFRSCWLNQHPVHSPSCGEGLCTKSLQHRSGKKPSKPININILCGTLSGSNQTRPWDKRDTSWDKPRSSLGQTSQFLFDYTFKSPFCPMHLSLQRVGFVPGIIVTPGA